MKSIIYFLNYSRQVYLAGQAINERLALSESIKKKKIKIILIETKKKKRNNFTSRWDIKCLPKRLISTGACLATLAFVTYVHFNHVNEIEER